MPDYLKVPGFARLADYFGLWAIEPHAAASLWDMAQRMDLNLHINRPKAGLPTLPIERVQAGPGSSRQIAIVKLSGVLMKSESSFGGTSTIAARKAIRQAAADPSIAGILLAVDSPGGTVSGTSDLADEVRAARVSKPVHAHIDDLGASAAYWVASQAGRITANSATALIGSIGTLQVMYDTSAMAEKEGVKTLVFASGPLKGLGAAGAPITSDQQAHVQGLIDATQKVFDAAVMKGRRLNANQLARVRHGGVFTAQDALQAGLIDAIQPLSKTIEQLVSGKFASDGGLPMAAKGILPTVWAGRLPTFRDRIR